jgi:hypothetical protein
MSELRGQFAKYVSQASASRILKAKGCSFVKSAKIEIRLLANVVWVRVAGFNLGTFVSYASFLEDALEFRMAGSRAIKATNMRFDSFGSARVTSATRPQCYVVNTRKGTCTCDDHMFNPELQCKHQIAVNRVLTEKKALSSMLT